MHKRTLDSLSDVELHKKLMEYGLHSGPVTETTRPLLLKKLKTHIQSAKRTERRTTGGAATTAYSNDRPYQSLAAKELQNSSFTLPKLAMGRRNTTTTIPTTITSTGTTTQHTYHNHSANTSNNNINNNSNSQIYKRYTATNSDSEDDATAMLMYRSPQGAVVTKSHAQPQPPPPHHFNVVGRLLNLRDNTLQYKKSPLMPHESLDYATKRAMYSQMKPAYAMYNTHAQSQPSATLWQRIKAVAGSWRGFKTAHIPHAIICVFVTFLLVVAAFYLIKHPDLASLIREDNTNYVLCKQGLVGGGDIGTAHKPLFNCLEERTVGQAMAYNRQLIQLLHEQAVRHFCINSTQPYYVSTHDFLAHLMGQDSNGHDNMDSWRMRGILQDFQACVYLIKQNPQWNVAILNREGMTLEAQQLKLYVADGDTRFALVKPNLPLSCVLYNKMQRFFFIMGLGVLFMTVCSVIYGIFRHVQKLKHERQTAVSNFCTEIINAVLYQASLNESGNSAEKEIIVNHMRDKLVPLNKRKEYLPYWNEALNMLEANESRLQFGTTLRSGEEFRCVRWVANVANDSRDLNYRKQWQSPAFDNANKICNPPTPCLKIRYMFDNSEVKMPNLRKVIEEAIFEKVGTRCNILDIQLDLQSCCVYVRCASDVDAGVAHNEINGWWFDKRLISTKFVRLQRYLSRFPETKS